MTRLRPSQADIPRLRTPLGELITGSPTETIPKLRTLIQQNKPPKVIAVGDVVSQETMAAGLQVNLRIIDHMTLRKSIGPITMKAERTYRVKNPAGVITQEAWDTIKKAMKNQDAVVLVDGEEDLLAIPAILESPHDAFIIYGQPSEGLVVVTVSDHIKREVRQIVNRMREETEP